MYVFVIKVPCLRETAHVVIVNRRDTYRLQNVGWCRRFLRPLAGEVLAT